MNRRQRRKVARRWVETAERWTAIADAAHEAARVMAAAGKWRDAIEALNIARDAEAESLSLLVRTLPILRRLR